MKSTYTDKLPEMVDTRTGRVHTSYHQAVTATGRLSSSDPNLQNIPIRTQEGRRIRQAFVAPEGRKIVAADYSQIELRIMAHLSSDAGLLHAFANELDVHSATAAEVFDVSLDAVTTDQRRKAKAINFGLIYGMSAFGLAKQIGVARVKPKSTSIDILLAIRGSLTIWMRRAPLLTSRATLKRCWVDGFIYRKSMREISSDNWLLSEPRSMRRCRARQQTSLN